MSISSAVSFSTYSTAFTMWFGFRFFGSGNRSPGHFLRDIPGQRRDRLGSSRKVGGILLDANAGIAHGGSGGDGGPTSHEWVQNDAFSQGKRGPDKLAHEGLGLEGR